MWDKDLERQAENWARWALSRKQGTCRSLERYYRSLPGEWGEDAPMPKAMIPINSIDACGFDKLVSRIPSRPRDFRSIFASFYLREMAIPRTGVVIFQPVGRTNIVRMSQRTYYRHLWQARTMLSNIVRR